MKITWTKNARAGMRGVASYIRHEFGKRAKQQFLQKVVRAEEQLLAMPNIGKPEPLLDEAPEMYRSIVINGLNKLVYRIIGNTILIVAFWDTRSEPEAQVEDLK